MTRRVVGAGVDRKATLLACAGRKVALLNQTEAVAGEVSNATLLSPEVLNVAFLTTLGAGERA